jgi:flagellar protein FlaI
MGLLEKAQERKKHLHEPEEEDRELKEEDLTKESLSSKEKKDAYVKKQNTPKPQVKIKEKDKKTPAVTSSGLLEKAQERKKHVEESVKEERTKDFVSTGETEDIQGKQPETQQPQIKIQEKQKDTTVDTAQGLLEKAQQKPKDTPLASLRVIKEDDENIEIIEEEPGFGWKQLGSKRIVFDHAIHEYRYEVIEPQLNAVENDIKKELSHLFKMLADIDTFDLLDEEKEEFLEKTMEQIITDNDVKFEVKQEPKGFFAVKPKEQDKQDKKPLSFQLFTQKNKEEEEPEAPSEEDHDQPEEDEEADSLEEVEISKENIYYHIFRDFLGYGRIDILMHDDGIEDISCDGPDTPIFIHHRKYEAIETNIYFESEEELNSFIVRLCQISGKQISIFSPIVDGKLPDGSRLQATLARTVTKGSTFTIRKFKENPLTPIDLIEFKSLSYEMAAYFWMAIENGASILFCGGTASGKTTALNALLLFVPFSHKIVSIEDTREVNIPHKNWIAGTTRKGFSTSEESKTGKDIDMFDLIRAALRQRPRVIIVGEVRGREAYSLFQAMATGHTAYATVHASTIHTLIQRLENPPISLPRALLTSLDVIVFQNAVEIGGKMVRRMTSVTEIIKLDSDTNQLIFMAPFTWVSKTDDRFESSRTSKIFNRIKQQNDWNDEQLEKEIANRIKVLTWMKNKDIRSFQEFGRIIAEYQKFPEEVLKKVEKEMKE